MAEGLPIDMSAARDQRLVDLLAPLRALFEGETSGMANLANASSAIGTVTSWHWVGFYLVDQSKDNLVLGPFQGPVACTRLHRGKGVCAKAWEEGRTVVVKDVHQFPGHVACSSASNSEVVIPVTNASGQVVAVLDIDSDQFDDFSPAEVEALEALMEVVSSEWNRWTW